MEACEFKKREWKVRNENIEWKYELKYVRNEKKLELHTTRAGKG